MSARFKLTAQVLLIRRLKNLLRIDETVEIDMRYITCAEYQLFIDTQQAQGKAIQPTHWKNDRFPSGTAKQPITGVRASDAEGFCDWLTQQQLIPGFRYRLPTLSEIEEYPIVDQAIGCWCQCNQDVVIGGIHAQQWKLWQEHSHNWAVLDSLASLNSLATGTFDRALDRALTRALDLGLTRVHNLTRARALALNSARVSAHALVHTLDHACDLNLTHNCPTLVDDLTRAHNCALDLTRALDLAHNLDHNHDLEHKLARKLARARNLPRAHKLAHASARNLDIARNITFTRNRDPAPALTRALNLALDLARELTRNLDLAPNLAHVFAYERALVIDHTLDLERALEGVRKLDLDLDHACNRDQDYQAIRSYLPWIIVIYDSLVNVYGRPNKNGNLLQHISSDRKDYDEITREFIKYRDQGKQLYYFFLLIELRRQGKMPAWEGIRIVRERSED
ncbi:MAG: SUMF1/EgtB/PvdO family nonheme iron enzyme [Cyanobacteria bacterium P01_A01_bin.123]